jgi:hypothetical protein
LNERKPERQNSPLDRGNGKSQNLSPLLQVNSSSIDRGRKKNSPLTREPPLRKKQKCNREYEIEKMHEL